MLSSSRVLYVVSRDRPDVYASLRATFAESTRLGIVMDRRGGATETGATPDRRRLLVDERLRTRGWARVRIDSEGRATVPEDADPGRGERAWP
jgi:hypothetical protein